MLPPDLIHLLDLNWYLFPVSRVTKKTSFKGAKDSASSDRRQIEEWYREYPGCNWRVHPGKSRVFCLDIDRAGNLHECDGFATMRDLVSKHGQLPRGPRLKTGGSGGVVAFFRHDGQELRGGAGALGPGIDVSTIRGAACPTVPPSVHQVSGGRYLWYPGCAPWQIRLPPIPAWVCEKLKPLPEPELDPVEITDEYASRLLGYYADDMRNAPSGASNRTLYACAFKAGRLVSAGKISYSDAVQTLRIAAQARVKPEKRGGIMPTIKSGLDAGVRVT